MAETGFGPIISGLLARKTGTDAGAPVIAAVGGGGKTSSLFALAAWFADRGVSAVLTTTTHIRDPQAETEKRRYDRLVIDPVFSLPETELPGITVLGSGRIPEGNRIAGIHPDRIVFLRRRFGAVLVEADGSRGLPVKAPGPHEPVIPSCTDLVLGLIGADCLGKPMDGRTVHRTEAFTRAAGCFTGDTIRAGHLAELARAPEGLFKGAPPEALKAVVFNKSDTLGAREEGELRAAFARSGAFHDAVILCSHRTGRAELIVPFE